MIARDQWQFFGHPGHFIGAFNCHFHLATKVGPWLVSTLGDYRVRSRDAEREPLGAAPDSFFETMVFRAGPPRADCTCGFPEIADLSEVESRRYAETCDAQRGHYELCEKWAAIGADARVSA